MQTCKYKRTCANTRASSKMSKCLNFVELIELLYQVLRKSVVSWFVQLLLCNETTVALTSSNGRPLNMIYQKTETSASSCAKFSSPAGGKIGLMSNCLSQGVIEVLAQTRLIHKTQFGVLFLREREETGKRLTAQHVCQQYCCQEK